MEYEHETENMTCGGCARGVTATIQDQMQK